MIVRRRDRRTLLAVAALAALVVLVWRGSSPAADGPNGKVIAEVLPVGNRVRTADQIRSIMFSRPGVRYEEATVQEDVRKLHATKWFVPGGVQILTKNDPDGRVTIIVNVTELTSVVQDVQFIGAQHNTSDLKNLCGIRKGEPMNPLANELGRRNIERKYQEDGRLYATVELVEGGKPTDTRVVYNVVEGPVVKVVGIDFRGVDQASTSRLRTQLVTKKEFLGLFGGKYNPVSIEIDRQKLIDYYHGLGFLNVKVTHDVEQTKDIGHVRIVYYIDEGRQYTVAGKDITGNKSFSTDRLDSLTELRPGERYDLRTVRGDMARVKNFYGARGFMTNVEQRLYEVPGQPGVVQVLYEVQNDRGQPDRVGRIIPDGNTITRDRVILNQMRDIRPGQILPYDRIPDAEMRLARLGIFDPSEPPQIDVLPNEFDSAFKDIRVRVKETRTGQFMIGGAYNTDMGLTGNITINEQNFSLTRLPTSWDDFRYGRAFRGDGQELRIELAPGTAFQRYSVTWREPYLLDTLFGLTVSGYYFQRGYAEYNEDRWGGRFTLDRRLDPIWRASLMARVEGINIGDIPYFATPAITDDAGGHFLFGLRPGLTRDTRDSYVYPTKGSVFDVGFEQVFGDNTFPIGTVEFSKFFSSKYLAREDGSGKHVLGLRSQFSVTTGNAPVYERFYGGGIRSFRGFTFRGLGPFENDLAVGGTFSWFNTIEYQIPILANDKVHWAFFVDHGTVERKFEIRDYRVAVGTGLRLNIPALGPLPLALDFSFPLNKGPHDKGQTFSLSVGLFGG